MNDESLPLTPRPTEAPTPLVAIEEPREAQTPPTNPTVPLTIAHKDDHTADHVGEKVREVSETTPEKPTTPEARHPRLKATARYAGRVCGSALDRAIVLASRHHEPLSLPNPSIPNFPPTLTSPERLLGEVVRTVQRFGTIRQPSRPRARSGYCCSTISSKVPLGR
jgi:hypothetical protein